MSNWIELHHIPQKLFFKGTRARLHHFKINLYFLRDRGSIFFARKKQTLLSKFSISKLNVDEAAKFRLKKYMNIIEKYSLVQKMDECSQMQ